MAPSQRGHRAPFAEQRRLDRTYHRSKTPHQDTTRSEWLFVDIAARTINQTPAGIGTACLGAWTNKAGADTPTICPTLSRWPHRPRFAASRRARRGVNGEHPFVRAVEGYLEEQGLGALGLQDRHAEEPLASGDDRNLGMHTTNSAQRSHGARAATGQQLTRSSPTLPLKQSTRTTLKSARALALHRHRVERQWGSLIRAAFFGQDGHAATALRGQGNAPHNSSPKAAKELRATPWLAHVLEKSQSRALPMIYTFPSAVGDTPPTFRPLTDCATHRTSESEVGRQRCVPR